MFPLILIGQTEPVNEEWLKKDKSNFLNLMTVILSESNKVEYFENQIENLDIRTNQEIGFGAKRYECAQYGGYITNWISIYTFNNEIFYLEITINIEDMKKMEILAQRDSVILNLISTNWKGRPFKYNYLNEELHSKFEDSVRIELGELKKATIDPLSLRHYETLVSPFDKYDFGYACYIDGSPPIGRTAIEYIKENEPELLREIIKGYCPEGRIYGIEALIELASEDKLELTEEDILLIDKVINLSIPINRCQGCMVSTISAMKLFNESKYVEFLRMNNIKLE